MRVAVAEDNALLRSGLVALLGDHGIDVVAEVGDADGLLTAVRDSAPDVALVDVRMPPTHTDEGLRAALTIRAEQPATGVLVLSQWIETQYARRLLHESPTGVGYLLKDRVTGAADFVAALRRVADGGTALDPEVIRQLMAGPADPGLARLSEREREILGLVAEGRSNGAIAEQLHLGLRSVEKHVTAIFTKLDLPADAADHRRVLAVLRHLDAGRA